MPNAVDTSGRRGEIRIKCANWSEFNNCDDQCVFASFARTHLLLALDRIEELEEKIAAYRKKDAEQREKMEALVAHLYALKAVSESYLQAMHDAEEKVVELEAKIAQLLGTTVDDRDVRDGLPPVHEVLIDAMKQAGKELSGLEIEDVKE